MAERVPLTGCQRELWLSTKATLTDYTETSIRGCYYVAAALDPERLREAVRLVLRFTPLPAATLCQTEEEPYFLVGEQREPDFRFLDASAEPDPQKAADRLIDDFYEEPVEDPLIRYALIRTGRESSIVAMKCCHLVLDGLAFFFHIAVIADFYTALARGETPNPGEPCPCGDAYVEEQAHFASARFGKDMAFWQEHLARLPEKRMIRPLPGHPDVLGHSRHKKFILSEEASRMAGALIAAHKVSPAVFFTAVYSLLVSFMTGEKEIVALAPVAYGERKVLYRRQGAMMALPPLLVRVEGQPSFAALLEEIAAQNASFYRHVRTPYQLAARRLEGKNFSCIADGFVNFLPNTPPGTPEFPITEAEQRHSEKEPILFGMLVMQEPLTQRFSLTVRSSRNHLSEQDVERFVARVETVVAQLAAGVDLAHLEYLLDVERRELELWGNGEARAYDIRSLPELFDASAERSADHAAVRDEWGNALSYADVRENSLRCARWLATQGVKTGDVVAVAARRAINLPEVVLGIQRLGAVYLPVDGQTAPERRAYIMEDAGAAFVFDLGNLQYLQTPINSGVSLPPPPAPEQGAYLIYTSGSTGKPKGVLAPHGGFANMIQGQIELFGVNGSDRVLQFAPPIFDASLSEMFMALLSGACLCPVEDKLRNAPWALKEHMEKNGISVATLPPSYLNLFGGEPFAGLRVLITAGEPPVAADALRYAGMLRYFNAYGPTETCVCASMKEVSPAESLPISIGRPIPNASMSIRDAHGRELPAGMAGELWIGGTSLALGYRNRPDLTAQRFMTLAGGHGARAYASGDLALWSPGGEVLLVGRADDQVKIRGNRVELAEVAFLLESCASVAQAVVLAVKDDGGQTGLAAFFVLRPDARLEDVVAWSRGHLPGYMVPSAWQVLEAMPRAATGKVDRKALQSMLKNGQTRANEARRLDAGLLAACEHALGRACDPEKSFFTQGGNSLNAMALLHALRKDFGADISFRSFVACESLFDVEALLGEKKAATTAPQVKTAALSMGQFRIWAFQQANEGAIDYNMPLLLEVSGPQTELFLEGLRLAVNQQELLRCTVTGEIDAPCFSLATGREAPLRNVDGADAASIMHFWDAQIHTPFDLRTEPPVRLFAARLPQGTQVLVLLHHLAGDGETLEGILQNALRHMRGEALVPGTLATQAEFCRRERAYADSPAWREDGAYWRAVLEHSLPPVNPGAEKVPHRQGGMAGVDLAPETVRVLESLADVSGASVLSCFVTLVGRFLCRRFNRRELLVGVPMGLRETQEEFCAAGFYVNTVPVRVGLDAAETNAAVAAVADQMRQAIAHSRYCVTEAVPEFLATHAHVDPVAAPGATVRRLEPQLRACKLCGSFTLETGEANRIILEYDAGFIADAPALLAELARELSLVGQDVARRSPVHTLADAWREILHAGKAVEIGDQNDFFRDGGDSIKAIQIVGILRRNGITALAAPDFLRIPRFAEIRALLESAENAATAQAASARQPFACKAPEAGTAVPLLPLARHCISTHPRHWKSFFMLLPLELEAGVDAAAVEAWLRTLPENHEALRMAFAPGQAVMLGAPQQISLRRWSFDAGVDRLAMLRRAVGDLAATLDPEAGKTFGAALAEQGGKRILLLVGHHLVLDAFSLETLRMDLVRFLRTGRAEGEAQGLASRALAMEELVAGGGFPSPEQEAYWAGVCAAPADALEALLPDGADTASRRTALETRLEGFRLEYAPDVRADLLSALACALHRQGRREPVCLALESHGRDSLLPGFDLSRSLGWFTAVCPMPLVPGASCATARPAIVRGLSEHYSPESCTAYGYLRARDPRRFGHAAQLAFNYLGKVVANEQGGASLVLAALTPGAIPELLHPDFAPDVPLELSAWFDPNGVLRLGAYFSPAHVRQGWVSGLLENWRAALRELPAFLPEEKLAAICASCGCDLADVERIAPPDPGHEALLYQSLRPGKGFYAQQVEFYFAGDLDETAIMRAWEQVVARHESLRSLFAMPVEGEFYRVALREPRAGLEYHDFSRLPEQTAREEMATLLRLRRDQVFDVCKGPLLRAQFFRLGAHRLVMAWSFHHLLMDGWCMGILLRELFALCGAAGRSGGRQLSSPFALEDYARWRARFDERAALDYWAELLRGFAGTTGVTLVSGADAAPADADPETEELTLDADLTARLQAAATQAAVTLPVMMQALWAFVLGAANAASRDVVFGVVTSGRPAELAGMDRAVGLFIQTLPLRVRWNEAMPLPALLAAVKEQGLQQMRFGYVPLARMGRDVLDHLMVFENYPIDTAFDGGRVVLDDMRGFEKIPYPLGISVIPGKQLRFRFLFNPARLPLERVRLLLAGLRAALQAAVQPEAGCGAVEDAVVRALQACAKMGDALAAAEGQQIPPVQSRSEASAAVLAGEGQLGAEQAADDLEQVVLQGYAAVLEMPVPSATADFFQLGGHSLLALRLLAWLSKKLNLTVTIDDVMGYPTPRALAAHLRNAAGALPDIPRVPPMARYPLSPAQQRIWFLQKLQADGRAYVIPFAARLRGVVDAAALQKALTLLEERHDALRLRVAEEAPEQLVAAPGGLVLECREAPFAVEAYQEMLQDMGKGLGPQKPLARVALFCEQDGGHVLLLCFHHIIFDGWSAEIVTRELNSAYAAVLRGGAPAWQPLELDYASCAVWEAGRKPEGLEELKKTLTPLPERLRLPLDFPRPAQQSFAGAVLAFDFGHERSLALKRFARQAGMTVFPVLLALVDTFLYRHTGQGDIILGCPSANRERAQTQGILGLFVNTLVVRAKVDGDEGFTALAQHVDATLQKALATQSCPLESLINALDIERDVARNPVFDVFVALEDASWADFGREPLRMESLPLPHDTSKFDLSFYFREQPDGAFAVHLEYCTELFRPETIELMAQRLCRLADAVLAGGDVRVADLDMLPQGELARLAAWNDTAEALDLTTDMDARFRAQAARTPGAPAVVQADGNTLCYADFDARVETLCAWLEQQGLGQGDAACVSFDRSLDMLACIFAVLRAGAAYVPLSADMPRERMNGVFEDLGPCVVVCARQFAEKFANCGRRVLVPGAEALGSGSFVPPTVPTHAADRPPLAPEATAYVIFTSGSTGKPKGVQIAQRGVGNRLGWMQARFPIGPGDVVLQKTTVSFDVSVWELFWWSWQGASLALLAPGAEKTPAAIVAAIAQHRVTVVHFVPSMLRAFLDHLEFHPEQTGSLASLRYVFTSGEALPRELVARFNALLRAELHNLYGPTEATVDVSWQPCTPTPAHVVPIGRPVSNTRLYVLDDHRHTAPIGVTGEIYISGVQVAKGYANRPDLTEQRFMPDPFAPGNRMFRTGDLGRWNVEGCIEYLGRNDDQVKIRGFRIELGEVEAALGRCAGVSQAVVRVGRIGDYAALEAFLLPQAGARLDLAGIRAGLAVLLPEYMHPARYFVVDDIPLSASGKADRKRLAGRPLAAPGGAVPAGGAAGPAGENAVLAAVRDVWREVMPEVQAGPDEGFFEVGGNSLLLVRLHALLDKRWPGVFTLAGLFSESSMRAQARFAARVRTTPVAATPSVAGNAPVAIIGMAVRVGDYADTERFWQDLAAGADKNVPMPQARQQETRQIFEAAGLAFDAAKLREASYLSDVAGFDYKRFGLSPADASLLDPAQRVFLETALAALDDAGYGGAALQNENVGVFVGASPMRLFQNAVTLAFPEQAEQIYMLNVPSNVVARLSYLKNWSGPAASVDTACSSVLTALHQACRSLRDGECSVAVVGGAHLIDLPVKTDAAFAIESASGLTKTFDAGADGVGAGEGAAVFVLKPLHAAKRDNDAIHAVILGSAVNQDGRSSSMAAPNPEAQAGVITRAARNAGVPLAGLQFFEAHGTATVLGDPVEIEGLRRAFASEGAVRPGKAFIGSVKGNLGHLDAAAGAIGLAKAVLSLEKGFVPPQPHFERPNPHIDFASAPVRVPQKLEPLPAGERPWRCGVSSFGLSGVNTHVVVGEHQGGSLPEDDGSWLCAPLAAGTEEGLRAYARSLRESLQQHASWPLHAVAATLMCGRETADVRAVLVAHTRQELLQLLGEDLAATSVPRRADGGLAQRERNNPETACGAGLATRAEAEAAAGVYLEGGRLCWPENRPAFRLHLPAAPFARTRLWPRFAAKFVAAPVQTPAGTAYAVALDRPDFWPAAEHRLGGTPVLVGMGLLDLLGAVAGSGPLQLGNLRWRKPVVCTPGSRATLLVKKTGNGRAVELQRTDGEAWELAAEAVIYDGPAATAAQPPVLNIAALEHDMRPVHDEAAGEGTPENPATAIGVSGRWQCREALWCSESGDRLLAKLCLPEAFKNDLYAFRWHPAMMDIAASLALRGVSGFVPAACGAARLHAAVPMRAYALVTITNRRPGMITANCTVADISGRVVAELADMVFMALPGSAARHEAQQHSAAGANAEPWLYGIAWHEAREASAHAAASGAGQAGNMLLLAAEGDPLAASLADSLADMALLRRVFPERQEEIHALAADVLARGVDHVLCLPGEKNRLWALCDLLREICRGGARHALRVTVVGVGRGAVESLAAQRPESALYLGPLLCLPWEEPRVACAQVEMEGLGAAAVAGLRASLGRIDGPYAIAADGTVRVRALERLAAQPCQSLAGPGCVVITGGLGGMGLTLAGQLRSRYGTRVVLLSRSGRAHEENREASPPFDVFACDVTDAARVNEVFARVRAEIGPIRGVIHAAGLPGKGYLLAGDRPTFEAVLAPKMAGAWNVHNATLGDDLAFFVMASSRSALVGAPGQSDYTAGNAFLNAFAHYRRNLGLPALSICWNAWSGVGMAARSALAHGPETAGMLAPEQALDVLEAALASGRDVVVVGMSGEDVAHFSLNGVPRHGLAGDAAPGTSATGQTPAPAANQRVAQTPGQGAGQKVDFGHGQAPAGSPSPAATLKSADPEALLEIIRDCLGYDRPLTREDDFFDLGGDSIAATRIVTRLEQEAGVSIDVIDMLESDTLGDVVDRALAAAGGKQMPAAAGAEQKPHERPEGRLAVQAAPELEKYPVGNEQLAILYADMVSEGDLGFNLPAFLVMPENLDRQRLENALGQLVRRHEVLRSTFCDFDAERPNMVVHPFTGFTLENVRIPDLSHKDAVIRPFDLRREGGFRAALLVPDQGRRVLYLDVHHALADGRTISLLNADLFRLYHGQPLQPVSAQMKDIAWFQVTHPDEEAATYWRNIYKGDLPRLDLPASGTRPRVHTGRGGMYEFVLSPALADGVKALARKEGLTNYHVALCAWSLLLQAYAGKRDIVLAVSVDGRGEHLNTAGMLASVLPLRFDVNPDLPLKDLLRNARQVSNEGMRRRSYILNSLLADLRQTSWPDRSPLSEVILSYMNFEFTSEGQGLFETLRFSKHASKTDISIFGSDTGQSISFALEYYADLFSEADMARMAGDYVRLVELMTGGDPNAPVPFAPSPALLTPAHRLTSEVSPRLRQGIAALAAHGGVAPAAVMLAAFAALLSRITLRGRFAVAVNGGSVAFSIDEDMEFDALVAQAQRQLQDGPQGTDAAAAAAEDDGLRLGFAYGAEGSAEGAATQQTKTAGQGCDLFCSVRESEQALLLSFEYAPPRLTEETAHTWLTYYERFLEGISEGNA